VRILPLLPPLTLIAVLGCASVPKSEVIEDTGEFAHYHVLGVAPFIDPRGHGAEVADAIEAGLQKQLMYDPVDQKALAQVLGASRPNRNLGLGIETLEQVHARVPVDAILFGRISPDWSAVSISVTETEMGGSVLSAVLRPRDPKKKAFADSDEIAAEALRVLASLR
jgi:hypothetical protein